MKLTIVLFRNKWLCSLFAEHGVLRLEYTHPPSAACLEGVIEARQPFEPTQPLQCQRATSRLSRAAASLRPELLQRC